MEIKLPEFHVQRREDQRCCTRRHGGSATSDGRDSGGSGQEFPLTEAVEELGLRAGEVIRSRLICK